MELLLKKGELLDLGSNLRGLTINCHSGLGWLTQSGDTRDHILRPGCGVEVQSHGQVLFCAISPCRIQLFTAEAAARSFLFPAVAGLQ